MLVEMLQNLYNIVVFRDNILLFVKTYTKSMFYHQ